MINSRDERNIFGTSSEVFSNPQLSSEIFGNIRTFSEWVYYSSCTDCYAVHYVSTAFKTLRMAAHIY